MARTDSDTWDLATSVGLTATIVAVGRALASRGPDAKIDDPFAAPLVRAVGVEFFSKLVDGELDPTQIGDDDPMFGIAGTRDGMAARTKFFDEFFHDATTHGIRQVVILASGLDSRAYRLAWPAGTTVYEIDQRAVIDFKITTLTGLEAEPTAIHRPVTIDLRDDWPTALRHAGFDPSEPSVWSAEGLFVFLPPEAQDRLLDNITGLCASGSRFASENTTSDLDIETDWRPRMRAVNERWRTYGFAHDVSSVWYGGARHHVDEYLADQGWDVSGVTVAELFGYAGLDPNIDVPVESPVAASDFAVFVRALRR